MLESIQEVLSLAKLISMQRLIEILIESNDTPREVYFKLDKFNR